MNLGARGAHARADPAVGPNVTADTHSKTPTTIPATAAVTPRSAAAGRLNLTDHRQRLARTVVRR